MANPEPSPEQLERWRRATASLTVSGDFGERLQQKLQLRQQRGSWLEAMVFAGWRALCLGGLSAATALVLFVRADAALTQSLSRFLDGGLLP